MSMNHKQIHVVTYGVFEYQSKMPLPERLVLIEKDVTDLLTTHRPELMSIETLLFNRNVTTAMQVSEARGVILCAAAKQSIPIFNCTPLQVKMAVTGYGKADKHQVKQMVKLQCGLTSMHKLDDAVDAIAIGMAGFQLSGSRLT